MIKITSLLFALFLVFSIFGCTRNKTDNTHAPQDSHKNAPSEHGENEGKYLSISPESQETMGLKLGIAVYMNIEEILDVTGEVTKDTDKTYHVFAKSPGTLIATKVQYGDIVKKGALLAVVKNTKTGEQEDVVSEYNGIATAVHLSIGQLTDSITFLLTISDLSNIYANFDVYEKDAGKVVVGQKITVKADAYPDKFFYGKVVFVSPRIDEKTRTIKIRTEIDNDNYLLKHGMFLNAKIVVSAGKHLSIPVKAVQHFEDKKIVFVASGNSDFDAKEIEIGFENNGYVQVKRGLNHGEKVVVEGGFLLKSELLKSRMAEGCAE